MIPVEEIPAGLPIQIEEHQPSRHRDTDSEPSPPARRTVPGTYGHDPDRSWLQGVLERHYRGYWCLRYCDPSVEDEYGGKVRLKNDERIVAFRDGDVVAVSGELTPSNGATPLYQIHDIWMVRQR